MNSTIRKTVGDEKFYFKRTVDAGHGEIDLVVTATFNHTKGTFKIAPLITTKHVALSDDLTNEGIMNDLVALTAEARKHMIEMKIEWAKGNRTPDAIKFPNYEDGGAVSEKEEPIKTGRQPGKKNPKPQAAQSDEEEPFEE